MGQNDKLHTLQIEPEQRVYTQGREQQNVQDGYGLRDKGPLRRERILRDGQEMEGRKRTESPSEKDLIIWKNQK